MPRRLSRLLTLLAVAVVAVLGAGCEPGVGYAAKVGPDSTITQDQLDDQLDEWASSATLLSAVGSSTQAVGGAAPNSWSMPFADYVLTTMIDFDLHAQEFDRRHLEMSDETLAAVEQGLVGDATEQVWAEVSPEFKQYLIESIAKQDAVQSALGDDYETWRDDQYQRDDIDVNPLYGTWNGAAGVTPPPPPQAAPTGT